MPRVIPQQLKKKNLILDIHLVKKKKKKKKKNPIYHYLEVKSY